MTKIIWGICFAIVTVLIIIKVVSIIRTYIQAQKYKILKAHVHRNIVVVTLCIDFVLLISFFCMISDGAKARQELSDWKQQNDSYYSELYTTPDSPSSKYILETAKRARRVEYFSVAIPLLIIYYSLAGLQKIFYITEVGLFAKKIDPPVEISVVRSGDKLDIYLKEDIAHLKALLNFESNSKNLAALGRFIEWDD